MKKRVELYQALLMARSIAWEYKMTAFEKEIESIMDKLQTKFTVEDYNELIKHAGIIQAKIAYANKRDALKEKLKEGKNDTSSDTK